MSSIMEWNAKPPLQWDWENLIMFNATAAENPRKMQQTEWEIDGDRGIDSTSFFSSGGGDGSGGSNSDWGLTSLSKSSKSASNNSSSMGETKTSKFNLEAFDDVTEEFANAEPTGGPPTLEASIGSGEPLLGLKLGKRMYFEDISAGSNGKNSSFPAIHASSVTPAKRSRSNPQTIQAALCQVEGCGLDLSSAKDYHRKHRVCENHSKSPKVIVSKMECRFCQQCSRFHGLSEFDENKRSCRRRLSDHNARRRKPRPEAVQLNPAKLSSSLYEKAHNERHVSKETGGKRVQLERYMSISRGSVTIQLCLRAMQALLRCGLVLMVIGKTEATLGPEESMISFNLGVTQDCHRALSLLSKTSWGVFEPKHVSQQQPMSTSHTNMPHAVMPAMAQGSPFASSEYRHIGIQVHHPSSFHGNEGNYIQGIQLFRAPYESDFYSNVD